MEERYLRRMAGNLGSYRIDGTTEVGTTERPDGFEVIKVLADDTTITTLTEDGISNALTEHNISGKTLGMDEEIYAKTRFRTIKLGAGAVSIS